ncbi:hypothetical protein NEOKW01_0688 [Nematocida sp. AWRm80]|nr:hypothetical protein NEOKW01_0688 [Nematocida sp. AWRm80]
MRITILLISIISIIQINSSSVNNTSNNTSNKLTQNSKKDTVPANLPQKKFLPLEKEYLSTSLFKRRATPIPTKRIVDLAKARAEAKYKRMTRSTKQAIDENSSLQPKALNNTTNKDTKDTKKQSKQEDNPNTK